MSGWRVKKQMKHPERGILQVTEVREVHHGVHVTGIITAPGIRPTVVEHKAEDRSQWAGVHKVPVMVDRADPSKFEVLWHEVESGWSADDELPQQQLNQPTSTVVTNGPGGVTISTSSAPEAAAAMEALLSNAFSQRGLLGKAKGMRAALDEIRSQALSQAGQSTQWAQEPQWTQEPQWIPGSGQPGGDPGFIPQSDTPGFTQLPDSQAFPQVEPRDFGPPGFPPQEPQELQEPQQ
jgi:hypothetical protein